MMQILISWSWVKNVRRGVAVADDYGSIEPTTSAQSGFETFEQINSILGFHMKKFPFIPLELPLGYPSARHHW